MFFLLAALLMFCVIPATVEAKPRISQLDDILAHSPAIVIATYIPDVPKNAESGTLRIEQTLRGPLKPQDLRVHTYGAPPGMTDGARIVAFLSAEPELIAVGTLLRGSQLEDGVLRLRGFNTTNAHYILPSWLTLAQLKTHLAMGTPLSWNFRGRLTLLGPRGTVPSTFEIATSFPKTTVSGMPPMAGFGSPQVSFTHGDEQISLDWDHEKGRHFSIEGRPIGRLPDDSIEIEFRMDRPKSLDEKNLKKFLADPGLKSFDYALELQVGKIRIPMVLDEYYGGKVGTLPILESQPASAGFFKAKGLRIEMAPTPYEPKLQTDPQGLIEELMLGPIACIYQSQSTKAPCKLRYVAIQFRR